MVTAEVIKSLYKEYRKRPKSSEELNVNILLEQTGDNINVEVRDNRIYINNLDEKSPFRSIRLDRVHGIVNFEKTIAIILSQSMILLLKETGDVNINIKPLKKSFMSKLLDKFRR